MSFISQNYKKTTILLVVFLWLVGTSAHANNGEQRAAVYFTLGDKNKAPLKTASTEFDCTDQIYTVIELNGYPIGDHHLSVRWIDPTNNRREHTQYPFRARGDNVTKLWAWLRLSRATGAGMLAWLNPAAGLEEFVGQWTVEVRVDNKLINSGHFEVSC